MGMGAPVWLLLERQRMIRSSIARARHDEALRHKDICPARKKTPSGRSRRAFLTT